MRFGFLLRQALIRSRQNSFALRLSGVGKPGYPGGLIIVAILLAQKDWPAIERPAERWFKMIAERSAIVKVHPPLLSHPKIGTKECPSIRLFFLFLHTWGEIEVDSAALSGLSKFEFHTKWHLARILEIYQF